MEQSGKVFTDDLMARAASEQVGFNVADQYSKNAEKWEENAGDYLILKSISKYCSNSVIRSDYCTGTEPVQYADPILNHYCIYRQFFNNIR